MIWKIGMPNLGHTMETGSISDWLKAAGEPVRKGEPVAVVESDKVTVEIESPADGILHQIVVEAGVDVPAGHLVAVVGANDDAAAAEELARENAPRPSGAGTAKNSRDRRAETGNAEPNGSRSTDSGSSVEACSDERRPRRTATPLAKRLAREFDVELASIAGSGPKGVVRKADVLAARNREEVARRDGARPARTAQPASGIRAATAKRMVRAWQEIPMVTLNSSADVHDWYETDEFENGELGINEVVMCCAARTLGRHRRLNAWLDDGRLAEADAIDMAFAVALDDGLITPVVRRADQRSVKNMRSEVKRLAAQARAGELSPADLADPTFTVSNLGAYGIETFTPIINPPQVAILGVGCVRPQPALQANGIVFRNAVSLSLVFDHRALDGAVAATFLKDMRALLQHPGELIEKGGAT